MAPGTSQPGRRASRGTGRTPRRRATTACEHCRLKKLKCDEQRPACKNCRNQGRECVHIALSHKPRPTKRRIETLEEENHRLRLLAQGLERNNATNEQRPLSITSADVASPQHPEAEAAEKTTEEGAADQYHGPTSAMFDLSHGDPSRDTTCPPDGHYASSVLYAEAARQRHLEQINLATGDLDFDGVQPTLAMQLLSIYWSRQLHTGLSVYRPVFMRDMACNGPYFSKLLLNAMFYSASKHTQNPGVRCDPDDKTTAGWLFRKRFRELLVEEFDKSKVPTIQALLIMAVSLFSRCDERSASWLHAGIAFNMIIDLGLHVAPQSNGSEKTDETAEVRMRVFWGAYTLDKTQCLLQGRPPALRISDANTSMLFLDNYEELEPFDCSSFTVNWSHGAVPLRNVSNMRSLCSLSLIMERILTNLYGGDFANRDLRNFYANATTLQVELEDWRKCHSPLPDDLAKQKAPPLPHQLTILALYNVLIILLRRPLITANDQSSSSDLPRGTDLAYESVVACHRAASEIVSILNVYRQYYPVTSSPYLLSYATYISATIFVRMLTLDSGGGDAYRYLSDCLAMLDEHCHLYAAAKRTKSAILVLMQKARSTQTSPARSLTLQGVHLEQMDTAQTPRASHASPSEALSSLWPDFDSSQNLLQEIDREVMIRSFATNFMDDVSMNGTGDPLRASGGLDFTLGVQHFDYGPFSDMFA